MAKSGDDWYERYQRQEERNRQHSERIVAYLVPALRFLGVRKAAITFDGYGDDGSFEPVAYEGAPDVGVPEGMGGMVERACELALPGGWEINEGSYGTWWIDARAGKAELVHEFHDEVEYEEDDRE